MKNMKGSKTKMANTALLSEYFLRKIPIMSTTKKNANDTKLTPQEMASQYDITEQAIRRACKEERLPFEKGTGKIKYLIKKEDAIKYMQSAKGKNFKNIA